MTNIPGSVLGHCCVDTHGTYPLMGLAFLGRDMHGGVECCARVPSEQSMHTLHGGGCRDDSNDIMECSMK